MPDPVRLGIVGASGLMGRLRVGHFASDPRATVAAACGRDLARLQAAVPGNEVHLVPEPEAVYDDPAIDAVAISVPNTLHYEHIRAALEAGKHVLCEYPLTQTLKQYDEVVALAQQKGLVLHHALTPRAESLHRTMKSALEGLGEPRAAYYRYYGGGSWYLDPALRGDLFCALHIHFIDQFVDLFGLPTRLAAHGAEHRTPERHGQVCAVVMMQWPGGLAGTIEFAMGFADKPAYTGTIVTSDGWVGFAPSEEGLVVTVDEGGDHGEVQPPEDTSKEEDAASFLDEVLGTGGPLCDLATGRQTLALCLECSRQMELS